MAALKDRERPPGPSKRGEDAALASLCHNRVQIREKRTKKQNKITDVCLLNYADYFLDDAQSASYHRLYLSIPSHDSELFILKSKTLKPTSTRVRSALGGGLT